MCEEIEIIIEALDERHVRQLHALYQHEWWTRGRVLADVGEMLRHSDLTIGICCMPEGRLIAFARVLTDRVYKAFIFDVIVAADCRGRGVGRRVMDHVIAHPLLRRVEHLELYCRPELAPFYAHWGFSRGVPGVLLMRRTAT